ncbi:hypothetical protein [Secundilactobacillus kimchicus]|nr:hypothetical protein [Secundilactobacillus kimchicus]MBT9670879.1 hypothetical protein [Secundilactobacillus kimchicus]
MAEELNRFRQTLKTAYDLSEFLEDLSEADLRTRKKVKVDMRRCVNQIVQAYKGVIDDD